MNVTAGPSNKTGYDPSRQTQTNLASTDARSYQPSQPHVQKGAVLRVVGGVIAGNAGKGAAAGAAMGGMGGAFRRMDERRQQSHQHQARAASAAFSQQANYQRAMAACLEGRGYSVK